MGAARSIRASFQLSSESIFLSLQKESHVQQIPALEVLIWASYTARHEH